MNISEKTLAFLEASGWTQSQLAKAIGVHPISLNKYLNRRGKRVSVPEKLMSFLESKEAEQAARHE